MNNLTKSQKKIYDYISFYIQEKEVPPTFREIQAHFNLKSLGSVHSYIKTLKKKGLLDLQSRGGITLSKKEIDHVVKFKELTLPFIGYIAAGFPLETFPQSQSISVPPFMVKNEEITYLLRAKGDTLIGEHILDGDLLLVEARGEASLGELILARLSKGETIVKKYYQEGNFVRLEASDNRHVPIVLKQGEIDIQGAIIGVLRSDRR